MPLDAELTYMVPDGVVAQAVYFRGGNTTDELIMRRADPGRRADALLPDRRQERLHVPLRVVEDLDGRHRRRAAARRAGGVTGTVVVDLGLVEV